MRYRISNWIFQPGVQERGPLGGINLEAIGIWMVFQARRPDEIIWESRQGREAAWGLYPRTLRHREVRKKEDGAERLAGTPGEGRGKPRESSVLKANEGM